MRSSNLFVILLSSKLFVILLSSAACTVCCNCNRLGAGHTNVLPQNVSLTHVMLLCHVVDYAGMLRMTVKPQLDLQTAAGRP